MEKAYLGLCSSSLLVSLPPGQTCSFRGSREPWGWQGDPRSVQSGENQTEFRGWMESLRQQLLMFFFLIVI